MTWWKWLLVGIVAALGVLWAGFVLGVTTQRKDDTEERLQLAQRDDSARVAFAVTIARLEAEAVSRETMLRTARSAAEAADRRAAAAGQREAEAEQLVAAAVTQGDSIIAYQGQVATLKGALVEERAAKVNYREAMEASIARSAVLEQRIGADSLRILSQAQTIDSLLAPLPASSSPLQGLARKGETVAIAAATYGACRESLVSIGCIAGAIVTGRRLK